MNRREFVGSVGALGTVAGVTVCAPGRTTLAAADDLDPVEQSIAELTRAQAQGHSSAEALVQRYLQRIERYDRNGPRLGAVLALNPDALAAARSLDAERRAGRVRGRLHGIPLLLKDNIETRDPVATTAGSLALASARHRADAPVAARLRAAGAIVLGKANLSEWANFRSSHSISGWSGVGGQTRCPYEPARNPSGSSSGSAVGTAANLCAAALGSETDGSILSPASLNALVGLKPTAGLVSGAGVVPITHRQDTVGPMSRSIADAALLLSVMAQPAARWDGVGSLEPDLHGVRLGVLAPPDSAHPQVVRQSQDWFRLLEREGFALVEVKAPAAWGSMGDDELEAMLYDFKADINAYLAGLDAAVPVRSLADLIEFNTAHAAGEMPLFGQELFERAQAKGERSDPRYRQALQHITEAADTAGLAALFERHQVEALVMPGNGPAELIDPVLGDRSDSSGGWPAACSAAAIAGYPSLTVPAGLVAGLPVGINFVAPRWHDGRLLQIGRVFERARGARRPPVL